MTATKELETIGEPWLEIVRRKVNAMRFGTVQIVVHEGQVTQVESTEKTRLAAPAARKTTGTGEP
jgi:hypothetical protein